MNQSYSQMNKKKLNIDEIKMSLYGRANRFILLRERTEKEIIDYLKKKISKYHLQYSEENEIISYLINHLKEDDLINDNRFIEWWVNQRSYFKPRGEFLLKRELEQKGISPESITFYFQDHQIPEEELVQKALASKNKTLMSYSKEEAFKKAMNFLLRRGFSYSLSKKAFEDSWQKR